MTFALIGLAFGAGLAVADIRRPLGRALIRGRAVRWIGRICTALICLQVYMLIQDVGIAYVRNRSRTLR